MLPAEWGKEFMEETACITFCPRKTSLPLAICVLEEYCEVSLHIDRSKIHDSLFAFGVAFFSS